MATNIIPFDSAKLPAYLKNADVAALNADLIASGIGFPVISIKGKTFAVVRGGERTILPNPKDPDSPATAIDVVIVKAAKGVSKLYYIKPYEEGVDAKPDCYSNDGVAPALDATSPQSKSCATCVQNQWGAKITDAGKKGKKCQDNKRIAVTTPTQLNEPYLLRVPPASFKALTEYAQLLGKRGVGYNQVVTKIGFEPEAATPQLTFKPVGFIDDTAYAQVQETAASDVVAQILGGGFHDAPTEAAAAITTAALTKAAEPAKTKKVTPEEVETAVTKAAPAELPKVTAADPEVDFDNLNFDD